MKKAIIIPGYLHSTKRQHYKEIAKMFQKVGIKPYFLEVEWKRRTLDDWVSQLIDLYK